MKPYDVMLDLETMSTETNAIVVSIGAVKFDPATFEENAKFYAVLPVVPQQAMGRHLSAQTMLWWLQQSDEAREVFRVKPITLQDGLHSFQEFMSDVNGLWGNGADFDNAILGSLYRDTKFIRPWSHTQNRCFRTVKNLNPEVPLPARVGTHHNALDDAMFQVEWLKAIMKKEPVIA